MMLQAEQQLQELLSTAGTVSASSADVSSRSGVPITSAASQTTEMLPHVDSETNGKCAFNEQKSGSEQALSLQSNRHSDTAVITDVQKNSNESVFLRMQSEAVSKSVSHASSFEMNSSTNGQSSPDSSGASATAVNTAAHYIATVPAHSQHVNGDEFQVASNEIPNQAVHNNWRTTNADEHRHYEN
jgi:hypothetical protein